MASAATITSIASRSLTILHPLGSKMFEELLLDFLTQHSRFIFYVILGENWIRCLEVNFDFLERQSRIERAVSMEVMW
jgi:hypothetical protein